MLRQLARAIVHRYPLPWRQRYEAEVMELINDTPLRARDLGELVRSLFVERARALIEDADHPSRTAWVLGSIQPLFVIVFMASAWGLGVFLRRSVGTASEIVAWVGMSLIVVFAVSTIVGSARYRTSDPIYGYKPVYPAWLALTLLPVIYLAIVFSAWSGWSPDDTPPHLGWVRWLVWAFIYSSSVGDVSSAFWPGRRMLSVLGRVSYADNAIKSAQQWVGGCHEMIAKGVPSPLEDAEAHLAKQIAERDEAREELQQLGYRARFQL
jgi:hypothetical protein